MDNEARRRLSSLRNDLDELQDSDHPPFSFALIHSTLTSAIRDQRTWSFVQKLVAASRSSDQPIVLEFKPIWAEPFPDGKGCVRWWGDIRNIERFKEWADKLSKVLRRYDEVIPDNDVEEGYVGGLTALCSVAIGTDELARLIDTRTILDLSAPKQKTRGLPHTLARCETPPVFTVHEVRCFALHFAAKVVAHLLGEPLRPPRLIVDVAKNTVILDGDPYRLDPVYVAILEQLSKGEPMTRRRLKEKIPMLAEEKRLDRVIKTFKKQYPAFSAVVKSSQSKPAGYWISAEYLT